MKLLEHEAKQILRECGVAVPDGEVLDSAETVPSNLPTVLKSQVPVGGRGKAGGVRLVETAEEARGALADIFQLEIKGYRPNTVLAEQPLEIEREIYLSLIINRQKAVIELVGHPLGGVEIESHDEDEFCRYEINQTTVESVGQATADWLGLNTKAFVLTDTIEKLYRCFVDSDATLLEINPLVVTTQGDLVAADCKLELDDMAAFRHPEWQFEAASADANFVELNSRGSVATIANGAGLAMATVDAVATRGLVPANFLDIGGAATTEKIIECFEKIQRFSDVDAIVINIFGGIVQCDTVARAIIEAKISIDNLPELYIRLSGTNSELAAELLAEQHIALYPSLTKCLEAIA